MRGNKNDYNDALAIAEAVIRPEMRFVSVKTPEQQDVQALHRLRERRLQERTALSNQLRGLLAEYGLILPQGVNLLRRRLPELLEDGENGLSDLFRQLLAQGREIINKAAKQAGINCHILLRKMKHDQINKKDSRQ